MPWFIKEFAVREKTSFKFQKAVTIPFSSVTPASSLGSTIDFGGYSHVRARVIRQPSGHAGEKGGERMRERAIFTIPNLLSAFRLLPAGLIAALYRAGDVPGAACEFLLSAATDGADGHLARKYRVTSDLGRVLDPAADKLTQIALLFLLADRCARLRSLAVLLPAKEAYMAAWGVFMLRRLGRPLNARWYGKAAAAILFAAVGVHLLRQPSPALSTALIAASQTGILVSAALYTVRCVRILAREAGICPCLPADARKGRSS